MTLLDRLRGLLAEIPREPAANDKGKDAEVANDAEQDTSTTAERWTDASAGVRQTAQWLATALGAAAAVIFGAGPLINNDTDVSEWDITRWVLVMAAAAVGVLGVVAIVSRLVVAMLPVEVALNGLPKSLRIKISANPSDYLPGDAQDLTDFHDRLRGYARAAADLEIAARREEDPVQKKVLEDLALVQAENCHVYRNARSELLAQAKYHIESDRLGGAGNAAWFGAAAIATVLGVSCFTFLTHAPADDGDSGTAAPQGAQMVPKSGSEPLWAALNLDACSGSDGTVPVILLSATDDHFEVQTLGEPSGCERYSFSVSGDVVEVVVPEPIEVTVTKVDAPKPSSSDPQHRSPRR